MKKLILLSLILVSFTLSSQVISTEAPSVSASAVTVPKHAFQIESTFSFAEEKAYAPIKNYMFLLPSALLRWGLTDKIELRATGMFQMNTYETVMARYNANNLGLGLKYEILNKEEGKTQMAIIGHFNFYNSSWENKVASINYALSHSFTDKHSVGFNLGGSYSFMKDEHFKSETTSFTSSLIYNYQLTDKFCLFGEVYGDYVSTTDHIISLNKTFTYPFQESFGFDFGLLYLLRDNIQLDVAGGSNFDLNWYFISLGFNILLNAKK